MDRVGGWWSQFSASQICWKRSLITVVGNLLENVRLRDFYSVPSLSSPHLVVPATCLLTVEKLLSVIAMVSSLRMACDVSQTTVVGPRGDTTE